MFITKPEITPKYIRIPVRRRKPGDRIRTIIISSSKGIKALYAGNRKVILTYLFLRSKGWTMGKAKKWVKEHSKKSMKKNLKKELTRFSFAMPILKCYEEIKKDKEGNEVKKRFIEGVASSTDVDLHGDKMTPNAIKSMANTIKQHRIELNAEHDKSWQSDLGGVEKLSVTKKNQLVMKAKLDITSKANDLWYALTIKKKELGLSIGGFVKDYKLIWDSKKERFSRVFKDIELDHIAVTSTPANPKTWVGAIAKSIDKAERLNTEVDIQSMPKETLSKFVEKILSSFGNENLNKILTNFSLNFNEETSMGTKKKDSSLESEEAKKTSTEAKNKEAEKDASELEDEEEDNEADSENQDNEDDKTGESKDDSKEDGDSDSEKSDEDEADSEESEDDSTEDEDDADEKSDEDDSSEKDEEDSKDSSDEDSDSDEDEDEDEKKSLTREEVADIAGKAVEKGIKEFLSNLLGKGNDSEDKKDAKDEKTKEEKTDKSDKDKSVDLLKTIVERQDKLEKILKKKINSRKTINSVAVDRDSENIAKTEEGAFKTIDEELDAVKKKYAIDPDRAFAECGKVRRKWADR